MNYLKTNTGIILTIFIFALFGLALSPSAVADGPLNSEFFSLIHVQLQNQDFAIVGDELIETSILEKSLMSETPYRIFAAKPEKVELWLDGVIPLTFNKEISPELRQMVMNACLEWASANSKIHCQFGPYKGQKLKVTRTFMGNNAGCWSMLGQGAYFMGLKRHMNLGYGCDRPEIILHEMGHVLGFTHEQQRSDRDQFVIIHKENYANHYVGFDFKLNLAKQKTELVTTYDFNSIMHYPRDAGSKNGKDTIEPRAPYIAFIDKMGNQMHLSELDRIAIALLYK